MPIDRFSRLTLGTNLTGTDQGDGEIVIDATGGTGWDAEVVKGTDESIASNTTSQDDDELFFTAVNGTCYVVEALIIYASPAGTGTPDFKITFFEDGTLRGVMVSDGYLNSTDSLTTGSALGTNATGSFTHGTAAADRMTIWRGWHVGAGGTFVVRWAQGTSNINPTIVRAGSILRYRAL